MEAKECDVDTGRGAKDLEDKMAAASIGGGIGVAPEARRVGNGFRINWMNMRDAATGKILWEQSKGWGDMYDREILARVPRRLLDCRAVSREVNFTSEFKMKDFRLEQRVLLHDRPFERWNFRFGFVMPGSTNTWQQVIEAADEMLPVEVLDGNVVIETSFFDVQLFNAEFLVLAEAGHLLAELASFALGRENAGFDAVFVGADDFDLA